MKAPLLLRIFLTPAALLLFLAGINGCRRQSEDLPSPVPAYPGTTSKHTYTSNFPQSENPISENGNWIVGSSAGASLTQGGRVQHLGRLWGDVQTSPGLAFGVDEPTKFGDPTAILTGAWGSDQTAIATVRIRKTPTGTCCHEVELRLRTTISPLSITGYEAYCSVMPSYPYCHIARWNGPNGSYWNLETQSVATYAADGDILKATVTGINPAVITLFKNGQQIAQAFDTGAAGGGFGPFGPWTSGSPGIGFYDPQDEDWKNFGFSSFSATDINRSQPAPPASVPSNNIPGHPPHPHD